MTPSRSIVLASFLAILPSCKPETAPPPPPTVAPAQAAARAEITALLNAFEKSGLSFERNGETLDNAKAGVWLRTKWSNRAGIVKTADDFIQYVAHHSSETKVPYQVVLADGSKVPSATWFTARLEEIRHPK